MNNEEIADEIDNITADLMSVADEIFGKRNTNEDIEKIIETLFKFAKKIRE